MLSNLTTQVLFDWYRRSSCGYCKYKPLEHTNYPQLSQKSKTILGQKKVNRFLSSKTRRPCTRKAAAAVGIKSGTHNTLTIKPRNKPLGALETIFGVISALNPAKVIGTAKKKKSSKKNLCGAQKPKNLLTYPVVPLKETLDRHLRSVYPLLTPATYEEHVQQTREFQENEGAVLQCLLEDLGRSEKNWLAKHWTNAAYLEFRAPVTGFSSPCMSFPLQNFCNCMEFIAFTARVIYGMGEFKQLVERQLIPVVSMDKFDLDNSQFSKNFGTTRKPEQFCDILEQHSQSKYVVVICKNHFYKLPIFNTLGELIHVNILVEQLQNIYNCKNVKGNPVGLLTHERRDNWAEGYAFLACKNRKILDTIERCLFIVALDENVPVVQGKERSVLAAQLLHGGGLKENSANRWMDKSLQLIVNPNGMAGFCIEHAPADCQPVAMMMDFIQKQLEDPKYGFCGSQENFKPFMPLTFEPPNKCTEFWLNLAERNIEKIANLLQLKVLTFKSHGKEFLKAHGLSPDSYIQMALQLAFYRLHKQLPAQYESAHLRIFDGGRTETIRSTSQESRCFVEAMVSSSSTRLQRVEYLLKAVDGHQEYTKQALLGRGVDRHLLGLSRMAHEHDLPLPDFFKSKGYLKSIHYRICSSHVATNYESFMAYGPLCLDGYGCCYNPRQNDIIFAVSAWKSKHNVNAELFAKSTLAALEQMRELIVER